MYRSLTRAGRGCVVAAAFGKAGAAAHGANILILDHNANRVDALGIIAAAGGGNDHKGDVVRHVYTKALIVAKHKRAQIKRGAKRVGNPLFFQFYKCGQDLQRLILVKQRQAHSFGRAVETTDIFHRAEELNTAIGAAIGLQSLKDLGTIVQNGRGGVQLDLSTGNDAGILPALAVLIFHDEHMVRKNLAKAKRILGGHAFWLCCVRDLDFHNTLLSGSFSWFMLFIIVHPTRQVKNFLHFFAAFLSFSGI